MRQLLAKLVRVETSPYVFVRSGGRGIASSLSRVWRDVRRHADLGGLRLHDLRHSYASVAVGFDPIHVANEGRFIAIVSDNDAERALTILRQHHVSQEAAIAGSVQASPSGQVTLRNAFGSVRAVDMLSGEQLPRIC